jgi:hypothetical protein
LTLEETMNRSKPLTGSFRGPLLVLALTFAGCGSASNSETTPPGTGGGSPSGTGGSAPGGAPGNAGSGGSPGTAGTGGAPGGGGTGGSPRPPDGGIRPDTGASAPGVCPAQTNFTLAVHIVINATWPQTTAAAMGTDKVHIWNLSKLKVTGNELSGNETRSCGTLLPPFSLTAAGSLVTGGQRVQVEVPNSVWEAPTIPRLVSQGRLAGFNPGSALSIDGTVALIGLNMADPMAPWPASYTGIQAVDADGDGKPGFTAIPKSGMGFVPPPTGLGLFGSAPSADQLYLASRTVVSLEGMLTSCTDVSGTARVTAFDSHVVGCHVRGGGDCTAAQVDFVDQGRTIYAVTGATFTAKQVPDNATCADVRAALP